jgi:hypothetical protein
MFKVENVLQPIVAPKHKTPPEGIRHKLSDYIAQLNAAVASLVAAMTGMIIIIYFILLKLLTATSSKEDNQFYALSLITLIDILTVLTALFCLAYMTIGGQKVNFLLSWYFRRLIIFYVLQLFMCVCKIIKYLIKILNYL